RRGGARLRVTLRSCVPSEFLGPHAEAHDAVAEPDGHVDGVRPAEARELDAEELDLAATSTRRRHLAIRVLLVEPRPHVATPLERHVRLVEVGPARRV